MAVILNLQKSDTASTDTAGVALLHESEFVGWIREGEMKKQLAARLERGEVIQGIIDEISREFKWVEGGGTCYLGFMAV